MDVTEHLCVGRRRQAGVAPQALEQHLKPLAEVARPEVRQAGLLDGLSHEHVAVGIPAAPSTGPAHDRHPVLAPSTLYLSPRVGALPRLGPPSLGHWPTAVGPDAGVSCWVLARPVRRRRPGRRQRPTGPERAV